MENFLKSGQPNLFGFKDKKEAEPNPYLLDLMNFFERAARMIQTEKLPAMNRGKVGTLLKRRLEKDKIEPGRIECMAVWYLTRQKRYKDASGHWQESYCNPPDMAVMLSDAFFTQILSEETNAISYAKDTGLWIDRLCNRATKERRTGGMQKLADALKTHPILKSI